MKTNNSVHRFLAWALTLLLCTGIAGSSALTNEEAKSLDPLSESGLSDNTGETNTPTDEDSWEEEGDSETTDGPREEDVPREEDTTAVVYDAQPLTKEDVAAAIAAYEVAYQAALAEGGFLAALEVPKPHWQYEVPETLFPVGWHCGLVEWDEVFGAGYYTIFPRTVAIATTILPPGSTSSDLQTAIDNAVSGDTIIISGDMYFSSTVMIPYGKEITIHSDAGNSWTLTQAQADTRHFTVTGQLTLENIILNGDSVGGGIVVSASGSLIVNNGAVIQNCRARNGGGIYVADAYIQVRGELSENTASSVTGPNLTIAGGEVINNTATGSGGGIWAGVNSMITMTGGRVSNNSVLPPITTSTPAAYGGGIYTSSKMILADGIISENVLECYTNLPHDNNSNPSNLYGAGVYARDMEMHGGEISYNRLTGSARLSQAGGGVYVYVNMLMTAGEIAHNKVEAAGSGRFSIGGGIYSGGGEDGKGGDGGITIEDGRIHHNDVGESPSGSRGGGIAFFRRGWLNMNGGEVYANNAQWGGGIYMHAITQDCVVSGNTKIYDNTAAYGAGIFIYNEYLSVLMNVEISGDVQIFNNKASVIGGGIYNYATVETDKYVGKMLNTEITGNVKIRDNEAGTYGGGIATRGSFTSGDTSVTDVFTNVTISGNAVISDNIAPTGGGVLVWNSDLLITGNASVTGNIATGTDGGGGIRQSAGIYDTVRLEGQARITGNKAENGFGGGIYTSALTKLTVGEGVVFADNVAATGCFWTVDPQADNPADNADGTHNANIHTSHFTAHFTNAYNNYDICYRSSNNKAYYLVTYDANGGSGTAPIAGVRAVGDTFTAAENSFTAPEGKEFKEWNTQADGAGEGYTPGETVSMPERALTLYAIWEDTSTPTTTYRLTVKADPGGSVDTRVNGYYSPGDLITITASANSGYRFSGWTSSGGGSFAGASRAATVFTMPAANVTLTAHFTATGGGGGEISTYTLTYNPNGGTGREYWISGNPSGSRHTILDADNRLLNYNYSGYSFAGWNTRKDGSGISYSPGAVITITGHVTLYAQWLKNTEPETAPPEDAGAEQGKHLAYIIGYPDGLVRPENNITRAESAMIFFRLLPEEVRTAMWAEINQYSDVAAESWCGTAISTLTKAGILKGRSDSIFDPNAEITRAEFAVIAVRFDASTTGSATARNFSDISGHWAEDAILRAAQLGYVEGYDDGSFHPDAPITRAEVATLLNRVLGRGAASQGNMLPGMISWPDNPPGSWYYSDVQEAGNSHRYIRDSHDGSEQWTALY